MLVAVVETFQNHVDEFAGLVGTVGVLHKADGQMSEGKEGGDSAGGENEPSIVVGGSGRRAVEYRRNLGCIERRVLLSQTQSECA